MSPFFGRRAARIKWKHIHRGLIAPCQWNSRCRRCWPKMSDSSTYSRNSEATSSRNRESSWPSRQSSKEEWSLRFRSPRPLSIILKPLSVLIGAVRWARLLLLSLQCIFRHSITPHCFSKHSFKVSIIELEKFWAITVLFTTKILKRESSVYHFHLERTSKPKLTYKSMMILVRLNQSILGWLHHVQKELALTVTFSTLPVNFQKGKSI